MWRQRKSEVVEQLKRLLQAERNANRRRRGIDRGLLARAVAVAAGPCGGTAVAAVSEVSAGRRTPLDGIRPGAAAGDEQPPPAAAASPAPPPPALEFPPAALARAEVFVAECRLRDWVHAVNEQEGQAPGAPHVWAARRGLESGAGSASAALLLGPEGTTRRGRQWVRRWRRRWGLRVCRPRPGCTLGEAELQRKARRGRGPGSTKTGPTMPEAGSQTRPVF